ncbi:MAG TPA: cytochrome d ubiquinol oxidase subunit II [Polyangiaceae bacterium]|nr:cytochrome d ubiquinol oxidase subunit II [Polyangiaceae bacterium]
MSAAVPWTLELVWYVLGLGLLAYVLTGGADFGAGLWDLLASGPRAKAQRAAIEHSIAPIWEANHVWLIFIVVVVFTVFPDAFATLCIAFHVPLLLVLIGIVMRGSAFVFRAYSLAPEASRSRWGHVFAWASIITPVFLGMTLGGMSSGLIQVENRVVTSGYFAGWTTPFALALGLFTLALFGLLAATYLCADGPRMLQRDFKIRALSAEFVAGVLALFALWRVHADAPLLWKRLSDVDMFWSVQLAVGLLALVIFVTLALERYRIARLAVVLQVALVVVLWGSAMAGDLILNVANIHSSGARAETVAGLLPVLAVGFALCLPALVYLFRVFKSASAAYERQMLERVAPSSNSGAEGRAPSSEERESESTL